MKTPIHPPNAAKPIAPYTPAIEANGMLWISGQVAFIGDSGKLAMGTIEEEAKQVMENIGILLRTAGLGYEHLVKMTVLLSDMAHFAAVNAVYATYFTSAPPAREAYAVKGLPAGANVEISGVAVR